MPSLSSTRLYLRGLEKNITEEALFKYLSCYGKISEVKVLQNYAFVQFESEKDAQVVLETYQHQPLLGRRVIIEFAHRLCKDTPSTTSNKSHKKMHSSTRPHIRHPVVVTNIPKDVRWQELKDFGRLSGRLVAYCDLDQTQRGRGFIEYFTKQDAERAVRVLDGMRLSGKRVRVIDHELTARSSGRRMGRLHSRSRSPKRALISSRNRRHDYDYDYDYDHRHGEGSTLHQTYSYPATDECYDRTDTRRYLSRFFPDAEEEPRGAFHHSLAAADYRVTNWKWSSRHDYHVYNDGPDQYVGEGYHDQADSGIGGSELCRDYSFTSQLDPYQL